jgi:hypothetical protein
MKRLVVTLGIGLCLCLCLAGCGGGGGLPESAKTQLVPSVAQVRQAVESFQPDLARQRLGALRREVVDLRHRGVISTADAAAVLASAATVEARLDLAPTTTTTTTSPPPPPAPVAKGKGKGPK